MINILIAGVIVYLIISAIENRSDGTLGDTAAMSFVVIPAILILLLMFTAAALNISGVWTLSFFLLYFIVPFLMTRYQAEYPIKESVIYGLTTFVIVIGVDIAISLFIGT